MISLRKPDPYREVAVPAADSEYRCALAWVNDLRRRGGGKPLFALRPGIPGDEYQCPIAASLADVFPQVFVGGAFLDPHYCRADREFVERIPHPRAVGDFVERVDRLRFPSLVFTP